MSFKSTHNFLFYGSIVLGIFLSYFSGFSVMLLFASDIPGSLALPQNIVVSRLPVVLLVFLVASSSLDSPGYLLLSWFLRFLPVLLVPQVVCFSPGSLGIFLFSWFSRLLPAIMVPPSFFLFSWFPYVVSCSSGSTSFLLFY